MCQLSAIHSLFLSGDSRVEGEVLWTVLWVFICLLLALTFLNGLQVLSKVFRENLSTSIVDNSNNSIGKLVEALLLLLGRSHLVLLN